MKTNLVKATSDTQVAGKNNGVKKTMSRKEKYVVVNEYTVKKKTRKNITVIQ